MVKTMMSQLPFGWVCFSNNPEESYKEESYYEGLNCLSAGSVSLTRSLGHAAMWDHSVSIAFRLGLFL